MIALHDALQLVKKHLTSEWDRPDDNFIILQDRTLAGDYGWVFFWGSEKYHTTKDRKYRMAGNAPIIVSKEGKMYSAGTAHGIDYYLDLFRLGKLPPTE